MLFVKVIGTGSSGNSYILSHNDEILVLDAGLSLSEIKRGLDWKIEGVQGVLVTHAHKDHDKSVDDLKKIGIPVWQPYLDGVKGQMHQFGSFKVQSFEVPHDGEPCVGYYIKIDGQKILYATDFEYLPVSFKKTRLNHMLIECNHMKELVDKDACKYEHQIRGHCSLDTLIEKVIKENMTDDLRTVLLLHMSSDSCEPQECVSQVQAIVGSDVTVEYARKGFGIELKRDSCPF